MIRMRTFARNQTLRTGQNRIANVRMRFANDRMRISNKGSHAICELRLKWKWAFRLPLQKTVNGQNVFSCRGAKSLEQFRKRSKICIFPENFQRSTIEGDVTLIYISISLLLYFIVNLAYYFFCFLT